MKSKHICSCWWDGWGLNFSQLVTEQKLAKFKKEPVIASDVRSEAIS